MPSPLAEFIAALLTEAAAPMMLMAVIGTFLAGLARGFSGFGTGLIFMPIASAALGPRVAVAALLVFDLAIASVPMIRNFAKSEIRSLIPIGLGVVLLIPVGGWVAAHGDPVMIRWGLSFVVFAALAVIASGLRWTGAESTPLSLAIGALSGFLGGLAALSGIAVVIYWLGRGIAPATLRANMFTLFGVTSIITAITYATNGMLTAHVFRVAILLVLPYLLGTLIGSKMFTLASPVTFRRIAYGMIFLSGVVGLPVLDSYLGR